MNSNQFNIIGCGQVGTTLGYLLTQKVNLTLKGILNSSLASAIRARDYIGQGQPIASFSQLAPANYYLLTVPDQQIRLCCDQLAATGILRPGDLVLHCSGSLSSEELASARAQGATVASLHPIKSFVDPQLSIQTFTGTFCGIEGDLKACETIRHWIQHLGGETLSILPQQKLIYHAAFVMGCNYLTALTEVALRCLKQVDIAPEKGLGALQSLMRLTLEQIFVKGTAGALSGPIARGEWEVVAKQVTALAQHDAEIATLYKSLGKVAIELARSKNPDNELNLLNIQEILA